MNARSHLSILRCRLDRALHVVCDPLVDRRLPLIKCLQQKGACQLPQPPILISDDCGAEARQQASTRAVAQQRLATHERRVGHNLRGMRAQGAAWACMTKGARRKHTRAHRTPGHHHALAWMPMASALSTCGSRCTARGSTLGPHAAASTPTAWHACRDTADRRSCICAHGRRAQRAAHASAAERTHPPALHTRT